MTLSKLFIAALFLALTASVASAYTLVMRDGRRVEIPNEFTVTTSTLTYEVGSGIQITIQLASIDVAATERANGQQNGSFLLKASSPPKAVPVAQQKRRAADRSITNADLEAYRRTRIQSEIAYEKRRKELGLPSAEQRRRDFAAIEERTRQQLLSVRDQEQASEGYWRDRASSFRAEIAANEAQIDFVRRRLDELPLGYSFGGLSTTVPFGAVANPVLGFPFQNSLTPNVLLPSSGIPSFRTGGINTRRMRSPFQFNQGRFSRFNGRGRFSSFPGGNLLALPFQSFDHSQERMELVNQLNDLQMHRAGLSARWREFEEEARRAGAYPGWLRP